MVPHERMPWRRHERRKPRDELDGRHDPVGLRGATAFAAGFSPITSTHLRAAGGEDPFPTFPTHRLAAPTPGGRAAGLCPVGNVPAAAAGPPKSSRTEPWKAAVETWSQLVGGVPGPGVLGRYGREAQSPDGLLPGVSAEGQNRGPRGRTDTVVTVSRCVDHGVVGHVGAFADAARLEGRQHAGMNALEHRAKLTARRRGRLDEARRGAVVGAVEDAIDDEHVQVRRARVRRSGCSPGNCEATPRTPSVARRMSSVSPQPRAMPGGGHRDVAGGANPRRARTATAGITRSTSFAAVSLMRRPPHDEQTPRCLHENATRRSCPHVGQRARMKPQASTPQRT